MEVVNLAVEMSMFLELFSVCTSFLLPCYALHVVFVVPFNACSASSILTSQLSHLVFTLLNADVCRMGEVLEHLFTVM